MPMLGVASALPRSWGWMTEVLFPDRRGGLQLRVLCANCHRATHREMARAIDDGPTTPGM